MALYETELAKLNARVSALEGEGHELPAHLVPNASINQHADLSVIEGQHSYSGRLDDATPVKMDALHSHPGNPQIVEHTAAIDMGANQPVQNTTSVTTMGEVRDRFHADPNKPESAFVGTDGQAPEYSQDQASTDVHADSFDAEGIKSEKPEVEAHGV